MLMVPGKPFDDIGSGRLGIQQHGEVVKLVDQVEQITFSGIEALRRGQEVVYVTERAVFQLSESGLVLTEVAPGIDVTRDVVKRMKFKPHIPHEPKLMNASHFGA